MIPARIEQFLKTLPEPDFFIGKNRAAADDIHDLLRHYVEQGTASLEVNVDVNLMLKVEKVLRGYGWTAEEAMVLFCMWCIVCPDRLSTWCGKTKDGEINEENTNAEEVLICHCSRTTIMHTCRGRTASSMTIRPNQKQAPCAGWFYGAS